MRALAFYVVLALAGFSLHAQSPIRAARTVTADVPRTTDGHPDLQGIWVNDTVTPLVRPQRLGTKEVFTEEEAAEYEKDVAGRFRDALGELTDEELKVSGELDAVWNEAGRVVPSRRTSLILTPNGRVPPLTPQARKNALARAADRKEHAREGPENLDLWERCLLTPFQTPMLPLLQNGNVQIVQTRDHVVILGEMIHEARIVPLNRRIHLPQRLRRWTGDSFGYWRGDTLVVDTRNFTDKTRFRGSDDALHVVESFTRVSPETIEYEFIIDNPTAFTRPWSAKMAFRKGDQPIYEYACHEGNYSMIGTLKGARAAERVQPDR
jgi:hypothetical protein